MKTVKERATLCISSKDPIARVKEIKARYQDINRHFAGVLWRREELSETGVFLQMDVPWLFDQIERLQKQSCCGNSQGKQGNSNGNP